MHEQLWKTQKTLVQTLDIEDIIIEVSSLPAASFLLMEEVGKFLTMVKPAFARVHTLLGVDVSGADAVEFGGSVVVDGEGVSHDVVDSIEARLQPEATVNDNPVHTLAGPVHATSPYPTLAVYRAIGSPDPGYCWMQTPC